MADIESNIDININAADALAELRRLQAEISRFHTNMAKGGASAAAKSAQLQQSLIGSINAGGQFAARMTTIQSTAESFTNSLEKNKFSMGEYFRYAGASTKTFGKLFKNEFDTINKVARERVKTLQTQYIKLGRDANGAMKAISVRPMALDMQNLATQTAIATQKQQIFNQVVKQGSTNLLNWGKNTQWAGRQLMVGFTIPLGIAGAMAAREFMKLEEQAIRFKRVYGDSFTPPSETDQMAEQIKTLGIEYTKYGVAVEKTMGIAADAAAMGVQGAALLAQVSEATRLAVLGGVEQTQALETTISLTSAFGTATEELAKKTDFLNAVENQTITSIEDLTIAIPKAGPVVQQLGGDVEDLTFFLTAMREGGINASEGANALKSGLASLINPSRQASELLQSYGINLQEIVDSNKGDVKGVVLEFAEALDELDPLDRAKSIEQLFGKFQFARLSTLFQNVIAEGSQAQRVLELTNASTAELAVLSARELARVEDSPMFKFKGAVEEFKVAIAPVGELFLKQITPLIEFGTEVLNKFNDMDEGVKNFIIRVVGIAGAIAPAFLMVIGLFGNFIANAIKGGIALRGMFARAGQSSQILGQQTEYMTQQQLEAATVAAALGQSHSGLTQIFTSEAAAVRNLAEAYGFATARAAQFTSIPTRPGAPGRAPKKYKTGVLSVPGSGSGDKVPAMLEPGEAVIPKKEAKKYRGLLEGIVADSIPGYKVGTPRVRYSKPGNTTVAEDLVSQRGTAAAAMAMEREEAASRAATKELIRLQKKQIAVTEDQLKMAKQIDRAHNISVDKSNKNKAVVDAAWNTPGAWTAQINTENNGVINALQQSPKTMDTYVEYLKKTGASEKEIAAIRKNINKNVSLSREQMVIHGKALRAMGKDFESGALVARKNPKVGQVSENFGVNSAAAGAAQLARQRQERLQEAKDPKTFAASIATPAQVRRAQRTYDETVAANTEVAKEKKGQAKDEKEVSKKTKEVSKAKTRQVKAEKTIAKAAEQRAKNPNRVAGGYKAAETRRANLAMQQMAVANDGDEQKQRRGITPGRTMGAAMAVSSLAVGASFIPGKVGEQAQQIAGPVSAIAGIAMALSMLPPPIAIAVGVITAMAAAVMFMVTKMNEGTEAGRQYAKSLSMTNDKLLAISEVTGTVSATEARREASKTPFSTNITNEDMQEGKAFLESDPGKAIVGDIETQIANGLSNSQIGENVGRNLSIAIAQGVMTKDQAENVAAALGQELGSNSIPLAITGKMTEILGPDGKNLEENPLEVTLAIQSEGAEQQVQAFGTAMEKIQPTLNAVNGSLLAVGTGLTATGAAMAATGIGIIPGAITAAVGGVAAGAAAIQASIIQGENNELIAAAAQLGLEQVAVNNGLVDSLNKQYDIKVAEAKTQEEINSLEQERQDSLDVLNQKNTEYLNTLLAQAKALGPQAFSDAARAQIDTMYSEGPLKVFVDTVKDELNKLPVESEYRLMVETMMATGELDPLTAAALTTATANNKDLEATISLLIKKVGMIETGSLTAALVSAAVSDKTLDAVINLVLNEEFTAEDVEAATKAITGVEAAIGVDFNITTSDIEEVAQVQEELNKIDGETVTQDIVVQMAGMGIQGMAGVLAYWEELKNEDGTINKEVITTYTALVQGDQNMVDAFLASNPEIEIPDFEGIPGNNQSDEKDIQMQRQEFVANEYMKQVQAEQARQASEDTEEEASEDAEVSSSILDDVVKKIRNVKNAAIGLTKGWRESMDALKEYAKSGFQGFNGLEQQLRGLGAGEDAISLITGMSKEEWEENKDELFNFDANGNITSAKEGFAAIASGLNEIKLGDFHTEQQKVIGGFQNQQSAISKLTASGMSYADALDVVQDSELARAIATSASADELKEIVRVTKEANEATREYNALVSISRKNEETAEMRDTVQFLSQNAANFTDAQKEAILADPELAYLVMNPDVDPAAVQEALDNAASEATLEIDKKKLTFKGLNEIFQDGFNKAMEAFAAQEQAIDLRFDVARKPLEDALNDARDTISDIQNAPGGLDDLNAELERIAFQEQDINEKYDERIDALDEVAKANDRIARQQKAQLTVADALTRGDISAAAVAAQEMRSQQAADAIAEERDLLEKARETELGNLTATMGLNREQIEDRIRAIRMQILEIEESIIEPYEYQIELLDRQQEIETNSLQVLGLTKDEWIAIENKTRLAVTSSEDYITSMQNALGVVQDILNHWEGLERTFTTTHVINEIRQVNGVNTGAPGNTGNDGGTPANTPTNTQAAADAAKKTAIANVNAAKADYDAASKSVEYLETPEGKAKAGRGYVYAYNQAKQKKEAAHKKWKDLASNAMRRGYLAKGGAVPDIFKMLGMGPRGTDVVPAMLTPGEFVVKKSAVDQFGAQNLEKINNGTYSGSSVYNYDINVNVKSDANAHEIARTVMTQIKQVESQRIRGNRF
jgi:TP901 family phage tail tape measure protein